MNDNVKPIKPGVVTHDASMAEIIEDVEAFLSDLRSGERIVGYGAICYKSVTGAVHVITLGSCNNIQAIGTLECGKYLYLDDACRDG